MARTPVLAAGGIVLRPEKNPLIAVVRLRKRNEWVLPKGRLDDGETPRAAAEREVLEETGHDVSVHEFLGTLVYESGGKSKVVHYWRMQADGEPVHELMRDVRAVDWLPLDDAVERLSRGYERAFLANVGPIALQAAAQAEQARRSKIRQPALEKRRPRRVAPPPSISEPSAEPTPSAPEADVPATARDETVAIESAAVGAESVPVCSEEFRIVPQSGETAQMTEVVTPEPTERAVANTAQHPRRSLVGKMRDWLRWAA
ncbi:MAG TPA: NUDIX hydrolase [Bradyrhizobium sp.]